MKKVILVTGTSTGFGNIISKTLAEEGHKVYASMRNLASKNAEKSKELRNWASENNVDLETIELDVTSEQSIKSAVDQIISTDKQIDVVINNAGGGGMGVMESFTLEEFKRTFDVNLFGVVSVCNAIIPSMRKNREGLIINVSSTVGRFAMPLMAPYVSSKWAVEGLTQTMNAELAAVGIDSVIVEPGAFPTTDFFGNSEYFSPKNQEAMANYGPLQQMPEQFSTMLQGMVKSGDAPDVKLVADACSTLINTPKGERPLRTVVDFMMAEPITEFNDKSSELQKEAMGAFA